MRLSRAFVLLPAALIAAGCAVHIDRRGYADAAYYERLSPYYENDLALEPRVNLRSVRDLVGIPATFENDVAGHADVFRDDIEVFFARPVLDGDKRLELLRAAVAITCPQTDIDGIEERIVFANENYIVVQGLSCLGAKTSNPASF